MKYIIIDTVRVYISYLDESPSILPLVGEAPTTPDMPTPGDQQCPGGNWDVWGDTCLLIRPNDYRGWQEALE